ncbi:deoxynucleoside kinase [Fulvivirga ligni]|uniref:deoxynucleoside kinase n=1 Tax=Fulvivirga ligni TaxID=2904246 RepID=UPI001F1E85B1|nr:deoxynucleoside kinase [Fulvivirga ligni]UII19460.1 deoxynucleoside kinase [Fulvivirga ligni]
MHVAICGNIGCGKTTLAKMLAKHYKWHAELESVDDNPYLQDFYEDMKRWSFHLQIYFLNSRFNQIKRIRQSSTTTIQDRTIYEDAYIFANNLYKSEYLNDRDYNSYLNLFHSMLEHVQAPDLMIYLKADIPKLVSQIEKRGRDYENAIRLDYLKNLNQHYTDWIGNYKEGKLLIIDVNNLDYVANPEDFSGIVNKIDVELHGLFSKSS